MDERALRIIEVAMELAERDGYDAVRLRDISAQAGVALGTVYRRFSSKEDILAAALQLEVVRMQGLLDSSPFPGDSPRQRLTGFFRLATGALTARPKLARAMLRTVASGEPELTEKVTRYHGAMTDMVRAVLRGGSESTGQDNLVALLLQNIWFAALVGWAGGLHSPDEVVELMEEASSLLLRGAVGGTDG
jgi:AcrR family transcriptional regulator